MGLKKAETFQAEEAECHKHNYDKHSRAAALEFGDTVLVHVTTFKSHHKIQDRWENREYVVDKHLYPNVPVYVVWPRDGEGCSQTLHRNYLLPINSKMGQDVKDTLMAGVENNNTLIPATPVDREPAEAGPSGMVILSTVGNTPQSSLDQPAPLRCSVQKSQNWLPCSYLNFSLLAAIGPSGIWDEWIGLCICLHVIFCLYTISWKSIVWITLY